MPDDPWFEDMDSAIWLWMYESWIQDQEQAHEFAESYAVLTGSAANQDWARRMMKAKNPDYESSDEDFDRVSNEILKQDQIVKPKKHRRHIIKEEQRNNIV